MKLFAINKNHHEQPFPLQTGYGGVVDMDQLRAMLFMASSMLNLADAHLKVVVVVRWLRYTSGDVFGLGLCSIYPSIYLSIYLPIYLSIFPSIYLITSPSTEHSDFRYRGCDIIEQAWTFQTSSQVVSFYVPLFCVCV